MPASSPQPNAMAAVPAQEVSVPVPGAVPTQVLAVAMTTQGLAASSVQRPDMGVTISCQLWENDLEPITRVAVLPVQ